MLLKFEEINFDGSFEIQVTKQFLIQVPIIQNDYYWIF